MNNKLEELSKKLAAEIKLKEEAMRNDARNKIAAENAGTIGAIKGVLLGGAAGFIAYIAAVTFGLKASDNTLYLILFICIIVGACLGGYIGYNDAYRSKRI